MHAGQVDLASFTAQDLEDVVCCLCGVPGEPRNDLPPFGVVTCPSCGLVFVSPRLNEAGRKRLYDDVAYFEGGVYSDAASSLGLADRWQRAWIAGRLDAIEDAVGRLDGRRLLEVGCAYGRFLEGALGRGAEAVGLEFSAPAAAEVQARLGIDVHHGEVVGLDLSDASFDVVAAWDTIEHVPDPVAFLRAVGRLTAPGGAVALSLPYVTSWPARLLGARWWTLKPWEHVWHFSPATLRRAADLAGLRLTALSTSPLRRENLGRLDSMFALLRRP